MKKGYELQYIINYILLLLKFGKCLKTTEATDKLLQPGHAFLRDNTSSIEAIIMTLCIGISGLWYFFSLGTFSDFRFKVTILYKRSKEIK